MIRADLHFHTRYSLDATQQPKMIVERLNRHPTLKAIAITDHNTTKGYTETREYARAYPDVLIIPGVELSAKEGEIILLGTSELPPQPWTAQNIIDHAKAHSYLTIASHPYRGLGLKDLIKELDLDGVETLNGITEPELNRQAQQAAAALKLPCTAGSDAHFDTDSWNAQTEIQAVLDVDDILAAIRKGHTCTLTVTDPTHP